MFISPPVLGAIAPLPFILAVALAADSSVSSSLSSTSTSAIATTTTNSSPSSSSYSSVKPTKNYIDTISGYDELSTCAEKVLSTIVRAQSSGCGDSGALTSYTCFCTDSSSHFSYEITSAVSVTCDSAIASEQASSAISVFDAYCALGVPAAAKVTTGSTTSATGTATPAASASSTAATSTSSSTPQSHSRGAAEINSAIIAAAVIVPVCAIGLCAMWCFLWRRRRRETRITERMEKQRELEDMPSREAPRRRVETVRATTEFKWPPRMGDGTYVAPAMVQMAEGEQQQQQHQYHNQQQQQQQYQQPPYYQQHQQQPQQQHYSQSPSPTPPPAALLQEKELVNSPTAASFQSSGATLSSPEYHISPKSYSHEDELLKQQQQKYQSPYVHQTEPAELPHHDIPELYDHKQDAQQQQQPHELPAAMPQQNFPLELEGSAGVETPKLPRSRFSYQTGR